MSSNIVDLFNNILPIIQAPMASITTPKLVAAVSNSGAMGSFGFAYSSAEKINSDLREVRRLTKKPINTNFFIFSHPEIPSDDEYQKAIKFLEELPIKGDIQYNIPSPPYFPNLDQQLEPIWEYTPELITFHFGVPPFHVIEKAHSLGMLVGVTATCLDDAHSIEISGADFVIAQGIEAGGHRGTFDSYSVSDEKLHTSDLLKSFIENCSIPIISAGGIMDGKDIVNFLNKGALAVQMGTAFLCCDEAGKSSLYRDAISTHQKRQTAYTLGFSGRWAQGIENEFMSKIDKNFVLPFPLQNSLTSPLRAFAETMNNLEYQSIWAGTGFKQARSLPASQLISELILEMQI